VQAQIADQVAADLLAEEGGQFCAGELFARLEVVGLVRGGGFDFTLTQADVGDVLGLSNVHVNRTVQDLRSQGLIAWDRKMVMILDHPRLRCLADSIRHTSIW